MGRDDNGEGTGAQSLFYRSKSDTDIFRVERITDTNANVQFNSSFTASTDTWYHVAAAGDATAETLELFIDGVSVSSATGYTGLFDPTGNQTWTLGRGQFNNTPADYLNGDLDEVRFSDSALDPSQFLNAIPEPSTYALLFGLSALTWVAIRRRKV